MSETLIAILLVTSSAKESSLVYRWPPHPVTRVRLTRPRPVGDLVTHTDNPWRASNLTEGVSEDTLRPLLERGNSHEDEYVWRRPAATPRRRSNSHTRSHPTSRRQSPSKEYPADGSADSSSSELYSHVLGYSAEFLAGMLCPHKSMCHQKFELVVDDLAFTGHPVCVDADGTWRFKPEKPKMAPRGRGSRKGQSPQVDEKALTPEKNGEVKRSQQEQSWLETFHMVFVLDLPDPSSSQSGNLSKYFDTIYEQIAFTMTAVLYQEQILHNYVETECDLLGTLENDHIDKGKPFADFMSQALKASSIASAMKTLYEAIKDNTIARLSINEFPLELQLPPYLDELLHNDDNTALDAQEEDEFEVGGVQSWGPEMSFAWRLPSLAPWKALLRLDNEGEQGYELYLKLRGPQLASQDRELAEQLLKFLDLASITLCLADMASLLDWDLESQVYPTVRWLVHHRRAKIVDVVHPGLKTVFSLPPTLPATVATLTADFAKAFTHSSLPPFPKLLSLITTATYEQTTNHFYASVVRSKELIPIYQDVIIWMLKRDLLETLHLRIRIVATPELKEHVCVQRRLAIARKSRVFGAKGNEKDKEDQDKVKDNSPSTAAADSSPVEYWVSMSPKSARRQTRQLSQTRKRERSYSVQSRKSEKGGHDEKDGDGEDEEDEEDTTSHGEDDLSVDWDDPRASIIRDPGRATPMERQWLNAMSEGKNEYLRRRFERINQYFNGKCTDDEILYKADISRKQLREVLHHYKEYLQTSLHPS
ncbi:nitrogen permease regulator of amino acid transport activity 3-domain-containing protein [Cristinia sonorae]|uniref:Nitrogen permease regulator 3 n=1 Tax=Cristinia sonorae TaxID=1940300 RepID=A0A8K0UNU3_9AGAR|nr:nitrogen permease regulator of amino acid transport activity 3-domain-containing protein [Cristinia sonorae]